MSRIFKSLLAAAIIGYLLWYLAERWDQLTEVLRLTPGRLGLLYLVCLGLSLVSARVVQHLLNTLDTPTRLGEMVCLQNAALLLNYAPMKFGTVFRANYLKRHYGLAYTHFATFFLYITFLMTLIAAIVGLGVLLGVYGLGAHHTKVMAGVFVIAIVVSFAALMAPLPQPPGKSRLGRALRNFLQARQRISRQRRTIAGASLLLALNFVLTALRLAVIYDSIGEGIEPAGCIVLGALAFVVLFVGITPGALGIKELTLAFGGVMLGVQEEEAVLAAMIDRAVTLTYAFVVGGGCSLYLWRRFPGDFKSETEAPADQ